MTNCVFCKIATGEMPANVIYRDDDILAFRDIHPQAPTHILVIPKKHITSVMDIQAGDIDLMGRLVATAVDLAKAEGLQAGFRLVTNSGPQGGQVIKHLHFHLLGGRQLHRLG